jgi:hypothetical protein
VNAFDEYSKFDWGGEKRCILDIVPAFVQSYGAYTGLICASKTGA